MNKGSGKKKNKPSNLGKQDGNLPLKILIAEDNSINQKLLMNILGMQGYSPDAVADGQEVLKAVQKKKYDLILMDIQMPEMNGQETAARLHESLKDETPKIIAVTAYAMTGDREKFIQAGMDGYIGKPFRVEELMNEIRRVMNNSEET
jgi:CheY-like chemotaxis protein